jgi:hypothetical protein
MQALRTLHKKGEWYKNSMCRLCLKSIRGESYNVSLETNKINQHQVQS